MLEFKCARCANEFYARTITDPPVDPFSHVDPKETLSSFQLTRLERLWERDDFGTLYTRGLWTYCDIYEQVAAWHRAENKGFLFSGDYGVGKTMTCALMMTCLAARNEFSFAFWRMSSLIPFLDRYDGRNELDRTRYATLLSARFLFLDDAGAEDAAEWKVAKFYDLIETRRCHERLHVVTSNLNAEQLSERPGWRRIVDRLQHNAMPWICQGGSTKRNGDGAVRETARSIQEILRARVGAVPPAEPEAERALPVPVWLSEPSDHRVSSRGFTAITPERTVQSAPARPVSGREHLEKLRRDIEQGTRVGSVPLDVENAILHTLETSPPVVAAPPLGASPVAAAHIAESNLDARFAEEVADLSTEDMPAEDLSEEDYDGTD